MLNVKDAAKRAKAYVADLFADEGIDELALEGVEHNEGAGTWEITVGFTRLWRTPLGALKGGRIYKTVRLRDADGEVISVIPREIAPL